MQTIIINKLKLVLLTIIAIIRMRNKVTTLDEFIAQKQLDFPFASGDLSSLLRDIGLAAKIINREINKAGLVDILGSTGSTNIQEEEVQKLDDFANNQLIFSLKAGSECCGIASEENENFIACSNKGKYVVTMDPLDGSSNIDVNVSIGTIFSIYRRVSTIGKPAEESDFLQKGKEQVAAGYVVYGSSTMLVYSTGHGVNGFTLDPSIGEFCLSHEDIKTPKEGKYYSINQGYRSKFSEGLNKYLDYCQGYSSEKIKPLGLRYIGSMVADIHRNLIKGGIFIYPAMQGNPKGKLRLVYECNPLSYLVEQAGGKATNTKERILDLEPTELHERTPIYLGSAAMVEKAMEFVSGE